MVRKSMVNVVSKRDFDFDCFRILKTTEMQMTQFTNWTAEDSLETGQYLIKLLNQVKYNFFLIYSL